jgi:hypothetical protein
MEHLIQWRGFGYGAVVTLLLIVKGIVLYLRPSQPTASTVCAEKQTVAGPKTSAVKAPTPGCVIRHRALEANSTTNTAIMAIISHEHQKGPG